MKEEIQEAAERFLKDGARKFKTAKQVLIGFAKWQSERMYSEEQVLELLNKVMIKYSKYAQHFGEYVDTDAEIKMYLEQFKKK
jgi:hypothetical protein